VGQYLLGNPLGTAIQSNIRKQIAKVKVKVRVTLRLTVSQSVSLGVEPNYGTFDHRFFFSLSQSYCLVIFGSPSLTRGRVCHVSVFVFEVYSSQSVFTKYLHLNKVLMTFTKLIKRIQYIQASFSPVFVQQIMPYLLCK
jgi:hypothetical protein